MILEVATLDVRPGERAAFEVAFAQARAIIAAMPGFLGLRLERGIERPDRYVLLVEWEQLLDHTEGFRGSPEYERWRALLHHFYEPTPAVEHFVPVMTAGPTGPEGFAGWSPRLASPPFRGIATPVARRPACDRPRAVQGRDQRTGCRAAAHRRGLRPSRRHARGG